MKKLLITLLFVGMFSQVSLSQIWESDTLPSKPVKKRYDIFVASSDLRTISLFKSVFVNPIKFQSGLVTNNFFSTNVISSNSQCCITSFLFHSEYKAKLIGLNGDTFISFLNPPMYSNYQSVLQSSGDFIDAICLTDTAKSFSIIINPTSLFNYYSPLTGSNINLSLDFVRSLHPITTKNYVVCITPGRLSTWNFKDKDTVMRVGTWEFGQPFQPSTIDTKFPILDFKFVNNDSVGFC
ncbi:MAG: hypothetical protein EBS07_12835, partial [Sphingobacteriia bacterium]|nr:hypothetical protein [Sphingobacteriia bacterium]